MKETGRIGSKRTSRAATASFQAAECGAVGTLRGTGETWVASEQRPGIAAESRSTIALGTSAASPATRHRYARSRRNRMPSGAIAPASPPVTYYGAGDRRGTAGIFRWKLVSGHRHRPLPPHPGRRLRLGIDVWRSLGLVRGIDAPSRTLFLWSSIGGQRCHFDAIAGWLNMTTLRLRRRCRPSRRCNVRAAKARAASLQGGEPGLAFRRHPQQFLAQRSHVPAQRGFAFRRPRPPVLPPPPRPRASSFCRSRAEGPP